MAVLTTTMNLRPIFVDYSALETEARQESAQTPRRVLAQGKHIYFKVEVPYAIPSSF